MGYSQNNEDEFVLNYFKERYGIDQFKNFTLLSIGENDGIDLSNARLLIEHGFSAHLVEPGSVYDDLSFLYNDNMLDNVTTYNLAIGDRDAEVALFESGPHVQNGKDRGLVSTVILNETQRWPNVKFEEKKVFMKTFVTFLKQFDIVPKFDFISIDAEGFDAIILQQMDLNALDCQCLCIEYNSDIKLLDLFVDYCKGFRLAVRNAENLIFIR